MLWVIGIVVIRAVITSSSTDGDAEDSGGLQCLVDKVQRLWCPFAFGSAPTEGENGGLVLGIMNSGVESVCKGTVALRPIIISSKVDDEFGLRSNSPGNFKVKVDFAICIVWVINVATRSIDPTI